MIEAIAFLLLGLATLGLLSVVAILTAFVAGDRSDKDLYTTDYDCPCGKCNLE